MCNVCSVCRHPWRPEIDAAMVQGATFRELEEVSGLGTTSLWRHKKDHLPAVLVQAIQREQEEEREETLLESLRWLYLKAKGYMEQAESTAETRTALMAVREIRATLEVIGKITKEIGPDTQVNVAVQGDVNLCQLTTSELKTYEALLDKARAPLPLQ